MTTPEQMTTPTPELLASTELWASELTIAPRTTDEVQSVIEQYAQESGHTIVGYHDTANHQLTLLRWSDLRPGYTAPSIEACNESRDGLAALLGSTAINNLPIPMDSLHCMMGRRVGGYDAGRTASMDEVAQYLPEGVSVREVTMVSSRMKTDGMVESYGEPAVALIVPAVHEASIHALGHGLEQHHYVIERKAAGQTDFYETPWAHEV